MPISTPFAIRLVPKLKSLVSEFGSPFHIYDEAGIRETCRVFNKLSLSGGFRQYFAVKALPNPHILQILRQEGMGFDCASEAELDLATSVGASGDEIFFTSNNTQPHEFRAARKIGAILNLDDACFLDTLRPFPNKVCFRMSLNQLKQDCHFMGKTEDSKFGVPFTLLKQAYSRARELGSTRFGIHAMLCSNERDAERVLDLVEIIIKHSADISSFLGKPLEFINVGGGIGIPYHPEEIAFDFDRFASGLDALRKQYLSSQTAIFMECGRYVTGPHGALITKVINIMHKWRLMIGVDAGMSALMRPALYADAYHHITLPFSTGKLTVVDVVGSLCENNDKFAIKRSLPLPNKNDIMLVHDTGAHAAAMGFNYNGRLRPQELMLCQDNSVLQIRRPETNDDYFATITKINTPHKNETTS